MRQVQALAVVLLLATGVALVAGWPAGHAADRPATAEDLLVVDCLLPGQVRRLGTGATYVTARRAVKTTASDCAIRGGEYTAADRADYATALKVWLPLAKDGDAEAQTYVGEIFERGLGVPPQYDLAARWYELAAHQGLARAQLNLGALYERGLGVPQDRSRAVDWYRRASGLGDLASLPVSGEDEGDDEVEALKAERDRLLAERDALRREIEDLRRRLEGPPGGSTETPKAAPLRLRSGTSSVPPAPAVESWVVIEEVQASAGLRGFTVNNLPVDTVREGTLPLRIPLKPGQTALALAATDELGQNFDVRLNVGSAPAARTLRGKGPATGVASLPEIDFGTYHALVIGNNGYRLLPQLGTAAHDAETVASLLRDKYGFKVKVLVDADRYGILSALNGLRQELTEQDNLLIYYAGHGELDRINNRGHWLPVDAEPDSSANWISNIQITDVLNAMSVRQILVVADSCYSGTLTRSSIARLDAGISDDLRNRWLQAMSGKRARVVLSSGGVQPVLDAAGGDHSVFARAFLEVLQSNTGIIEGQRLYLQVAERVAAVPEAADIGQVPQYAPIKYAGHEAGDFFFVPRVQ